MGVAPPRTTAISKKSFTNKSGRPPPPPPPPPLKRYGEESRGDLINLTLILLRLIQQHFCYNVTGQSQESEGSYKPARIKEVHSKLHLLQASLCTLTASHLTLIYVYTYIQLSVTVPLGCLIKQAGIIIHTILNLWEAPGIEPVTSGLTSVYQTSSSTT